MNEDEKVMGQVQMLNFIPDEVANEDAFTSHSRIATAIAHIIQAKKDIKVIGLLGSWGSGKSTVVKFVRDRLAIDDEAEKVSCFTYDAWLHQSDPPRRAFLETLIRFLIQQDLTTEDRWKNRLQELNRQIEDTESTSTPTLSAAGKWLLPSALLVPLGMQLVGHDWFHAMSQTGADWFERWAFYGGAVLVALPVFVAAGLKFWWRPVRTPWKRTFWKGNWSANRSPYEKESILSIFTNREVQTQKNRTIRAPDPTTIEFQAIFREIMSEVSKENRRFIFVVDNLDRLPEADAIEMWATIRSFFLGAAHGVSLPTVILPIDEKAVQRMYAAEHADEGTASSLAKSFMDKTFDLTFYVNRPVLSNWQGYLKKQTKFLFGTSMQSEWPYVVGSIYDRWLLTHGAGEPITPRVINTLLNSIGTLWLQWKDSDISFASIVYYAVHREKIDADILEAVATNKPDIEALDPNWQRSIVALHFGVEPEDAAQVLLEQPLRKAVLEGTGDEFGRLAGAPGFNYVFDRILDSAIKGESPILIAKAVLMYDRLNLEPDADTAAAWKQLRRLWIQRAELKEFNADDVKTIRTLIRHCDAPSMKAFLEGVTGQLSRIPEAAFGKGDAVTQLVEATRSVLKSSTDAGLTSPRVVIQGDPGAYLQAITFCASEPNLVKCLAASAPSAKVVEALAQNLGNAGAASKMDVCLRALVVTGAKFQWGPVITAAGTKLEAGVDDNTAASVNCLGLLRTTEKAVDVRVQQLADDAHLINRFNEAFNGNQIPTAAQIATLILLSNNPSLLTIPNGLTWEQALTTHKQLAPLINDALLAFGGAADIAAYAKLASSHGTLTPLMRAIASLRSRDGTLPLPTGADLVDNFVNYIACIDPDLRITFVCQVAADKSFWDKLAKLNLKASEPILKILLNEKSSMRDRGAKAALEKLDSLPVADWQPAIDSGAHPLGLVVLLRAVDNDVELSGNLFDALRSKISALATNDDQTFRERWLQLSDFLSSSARKTLLKIVADYISRGDATTNLVHLLSMRDGVLLKEGEFARNPDGTATNVVLPLIPDPDGVNWLSENAERLMTVVAKSDKNTNATIRERLLGVWRSTEDTEAKERIDALRAAWGFAKFEPEPSNEEVGPAAG